VDDAGRPELLAVLEIGARILVLADVRELSVVVDVAVLEDLDERRPAVMRGAAEHLGQAGLVDVERAGDEGRAGAERERQRVERIVDAPHRRRPRDLALATGRRVLPFGQSVDPVVEEQDLHVDVAAQRMDQVVAADRERVAVARHDPHREVGPRHRQPGRDRRRAAVDRVHSVGLHVVGEAGRAADARDEDDLLARNPELRHEALHRGEDRVVAAARAPADLLVGLELLRSQLQLARHYNIASIASRISLARNGLPVTRL
jgi:hypothetical protein